MTDEVPPMLMTDHAILRYAERVMQLPLREIVEQRVLSDRRRVQVICHLPRGRLRLGRSDVYLVIEKGRVATVVIQQPASRDGAPPRLEHT